MKGMSYQKGSLLPAAIFLLVVMALFSASLLNTSTHSSIATTQEAISLAALNAAESGAQFAMGSLFYLPTTRALTDNRCTALNGLINFTVPGLSVCSSNYSCSASIDAGDTTSYYRITSVGRCAVGQVTGQRTIEVSALIKD